MTSSAPPERDDENSLKKGTADGKTPPPAPPNGGYSPPGYPPHMMHYPPPTAMGYPPPHGPHAYQGFPPNGYAYPGGGGPQYYQNTTYHDPYAYSSSTSTGFFRCFLLFLFIFLFIGALSTLITWLFLRPEVPIFKLGSMSVTNFNASNSALSGVWEANVTVENPNGKLKAYFMNFQHSIYHDDDLLAFNQTEPLALATHESAEVGVRMTVGPADQVVVPPWVVLGLAKERESGTVSFHLGMVVTATFRTGSVWSRGARLKVLCEDLKVQFTGNTGNGVLNNGGNPVRCAMYY